MRKEVIIAIILGLLLGFVITFGVYRAQKFLRQPQINPQQDELLRTPITAPVGDEPQDLAVINPENGLITEQSTIVVTGTTAPNVPIVLLANNTEYVTTSDATGAFSVEVPLRQGSTVITTYVLREDGSSLRDERTIIQSNIAELESQAASPAASSR
jgi:hypothetical protein